MKLPTVTLKHKTNGTIIKINQKEWANDLGRGDYSAYERIGESHTGEKKDVLDAGDTNEPEIDPPEDEDNNDGDDESEKDKETKEEKEGREEVTITDADIGDLDDFIGSDK